MPAVMAFILHCFRDWGFTRTRTRTLGFTHTHTHTRTRTRLCHLTHLIPVKIEVILYGSLAQQGIPQVAIFAPPRMEKILHSRTRFVNIKPRTQAPDHIFIERESDNTISVMHVYRESADDNRDLDRLAQSRSNSQVRQCKFLGTSIEPPDHLAFCTTHHFRSQGHTHPFHPVHYLFITHSHHYSSKAGLAIINYVLNT
jgi:hypothetical protein